MGKGELVLVLGHGSTIPSRDLSDRRRSAMTLFEILLVLVLLVVVSSLAMPLFDGGFATVRLRRGSDQLLAAWAEARLQSIQTGQTHEFLFQPECGLYRVRPWQALVEPGTDPVLPAPSAEEAAEAVWLPYEAELPKEIVFAEGDEITRDATGERNVQTLNQGSMSAWAAPILFFPDGSTSSASLLLRNERQLFQRVTLRALTGVARVSDVMTEEQSRQMKGR